jgi:hypothetical protein
MKILNKLHSKNLHLWLPSYLKSWLSLKVNKTYGIRHIIFMIADHFEPFWENNYDVMDIWLEQYPYFARRHYDSDGIPPQHSWFFPIEQYDPYILDKLSSLCRRGYGEIEIHLHHQNDTEESLRVLLREGVENLLNHGGLSPYGKDSRPLFGFTHGNWALNNSRNDGRFCGVNDELRILKEEGCYADFTLPSAPSNAQTKKINSIYYAKSDPEVVKAHDTGVDVRVGGKEWGHLMLIQGPLSLNWKRKTNGFLPRIENSEISENNPGKEDRIRLWEKANTHVRGKPEWVFIKVHCHGGIRNDLDALIGKKAILMYKSLESMFRESSNYRLHYVTARECYNIIKAAEAGESGDPGKFRDYSIPPPANRGNTTKRV